MAIPRVEIGLVCAAIEEVHDLDVVSSDGHPIDAIAVGHYLGVRPQDAELALDLAISGLDPRRPLAENRPHALLTQYSERGIIRGELAQPFFLVDNRTSTTGARQPSEPRLIAIAGMGTPSRFGAPELTVLARELCWALGRMRRRHLATVLIGTGNGNLGVAAGTSAWIRGIKRAISGVNADARILRVTFVVKSGRKLREVQDTIERERSRLQELGRADLSYERISDERLLEYEHATIQAEIEALEEQLKLSGPVAPEEPAPLRPATRVTVDGVGRVFRFGAITERAAVPEREISVDPALLVEVNRKLATTSERSEQRQLGRLMAGLLLPEDFRPHLAGSAPLSLMLDLRAAQLHWEMLVPPDAPPPEGEAEGEEEAEGEAKDEVEQETFIGTSRGITRQLRAGFAAPPQPPPPERRRLRVMIVTNPSREQPLPKADAEGQLVADLFERFNEVYSGTDDAMEVHLYKGPDEATRSTVLGLLMDRQFDVLHFVGHSVYQPRRRPVLSGWLFSEDTYLTAAELNRLDRVPEFVFSNSCSSAALHSPQAKAERVSSIGSASTLAAAFLARGVANFVGTAWPIEDGSGSEFARVFYSNLLGLAQKNGSWGPAPRQPISEAVRLARLALAGTRGGRTMWGAYQHYGNPHSHLVSPTAGRPGED